jgi:hypothetical protein
MPDGDRSNRPAHDKVVQPVPAAEALSFLKEIKGAATWTDRELAKSLNISMPEAKQVLAVVELQGYVEPAGTTKRRRTTEQGDLVSGSKSPRFTREGVEQGLSALRDRIHGMNQDTNTLYKIRQKKSWVDSGSGNLPSEW